MSRIAAIKGEQKNQLANSKYRYCIPVTSPWNLLYPSIYFRNKSTSFFISSSLGAKSSGSSLRLAQWSNTFTTSCGYSLLNSRFCVFSSLMCRRSFIKASGEINIFPVFFSAFGMTGVSLAASFRTSRINWTFSSFSFTGSIESTFLALTVPAIGSSSRFSSASAIRMAFFVISSVLLFFKSSKME